MDPRDKQLLRAVGRRVSELRSEAGITQEELAARYGASVKYIQSVEIGSQNLTLVTLAKMARVLGVDLAELLVEPRSLAANPGRPSRARGE